MRAYCFGRGHACRRLENFRGPARIGRMLAHINARDATRRGAYILARMQQRYLSTIRAQLPLAAGSHTKRLFYERRTQRPGPRISSEIASTSITNSHLARPDAVPPSGGFSARCPPSCYFGSPESDFHFDGFLRISIDTHCDYSHGTLLVVIHLRCSRYRIGSMSRASLWNKTSLIPHGRGSDSFTYRVLIGRVSIFEHKQNAENVAHSLPIHRDRRCTDVYVRAHTHALFFFPRFCTTRVPVDGYTTRKHANERCDSPSPSNR
ncbi:hypothetical protein ALC62_05116 [Cyphomyrmex costatus]|uniref:Uncharacterized protein n=1 Tax=Cyphomyrmex costatus TaxID=456900 RepID=A0A195CUL6_9HYME|nr:hypothetical protein ALC62_05116 [Cyphomyrmex costatus]